MLRPVRVTVDSLARLYSDLLVEKPSLLCLFGLNGRFKGFFVFLLEKGKCMIPLNARALTHLRFSLLLTRNLGLHCYVEK